MYLENGRFLPPNAVRVDMVESGKKQTYQPFSIFRWSQILIMGYLSSPLEFCSYGHVNTEEIHHTFHVKAAVLTKYT